MNKSFAVGDIRILLALFPFLIVKYWWAIKNIATIFSYRAAKLFGEV